MPFSISAGAEKLLDVTEFPPDHSPNRDSLDANATLRTCLLFLRLQHPELWPSDNTIYCAQKLRDVLSAPLVEKDASKSHILKVIAACKRELFDADTVWMVAYAQGGKLAITALHVVVPGHRADFLERMDTIHVEELTQLFAVLATIPPHKSFTGYIDLEITDHQVDRIGVPEPAALLTRRKSPSSHEGGDRAKRKKAKMGQGGDSSQPHKEAIKTQGSDGSSRTNADWIPSDPPSISNLAVLPDNIAPPHTHPQSPSADNHSHTVNGSLGTSLPLLPGASQYPNYLVEDPTARFMAMRDTLGTNPGVVFCTEGWRGRGTNMRRSVESKKLSGFSKLFQASFCNLVTKGTV
ncbi:hypothetical protein B0T14DRAFT_563012 [Immersiella caudata]|uniref:Uncharacterized protein n=1 Tax=Immersiella caudata TaxID=314043 RepID=A0AA40C6Q1_9PEZI|nr:hypothetical protein B0T14DRAFT_563012 [Immersiella caudata]